MHVVCQITLSRNYLKLFFGDLYGTYFGDIYVAHMYFVTGLVAVTLQRKVVKVWHTFSAVNVLI